MSQLILLNGAYISVDTLANVNSAIPLNATVATSATLDMTGLAVNIPNTLVRRDQTGSFSASVINARKVTGLFDPIVATDAANKRYVDNLGGGGGTATLAGDVTGSSSSNTVATVGGSNAANINSATVDVLAATSAATVNKIAKRDSSGNLSVVGLNATTVTGTTVNATTFVGNLQGTADNAKHGSVVAPDRLNSVGYVAGDIANNPITLDPAGYQTITRGLQIGAYFPGAPTFRGFPNLEQFPNGRLWLLYSVGNSHGAAGSYTLTQYSDDFGSTWSAAVSLVPVESGTPLSNSHASSISLIRSGTYKNRLFFIYWTDASTFTKIIWSDDFGVTWTQGVNCIDSGAEFTTYVASSKPIVAPNGDILVAGYGHTNINAGYKATVLKSSDGGATWNRLSVLYDGTTGSDSPEQPEEPQMILLNDGVTILASIREDGGSSATATRGTIRFVKSVNSGVSWTSISKPFPGAFNGDGRPNIIQTDNGTVICITRAITSDLATQDGIVYTSHDNGQTWDYYRKLDKRSIFYAYGDMVNTGINQVALVYAVQNAAFSRADICFTYLLDGDGTSPLGGAVLENVRATKIALGNSSLDFVVPPAPAATNDVTVLQTTINTLINYLGSIGLAPNPLNCPTLTGLWEADSISNTINDLTGAFGSNTSVTNALTGVTVTITTSGGSFGVNAGKLVNNTPSGANFAYWDIGTADTTFDSDFAWNGSSQAWLLLKVINSNTAIVATIDGGNMILYKDVGGSTTVLANPALAGGFVGGVAKHIQAIVAGASITIKIDGTTAITHTLSAGDQTTFLASTKFGFFMPSTDTVDNVVFHSDLVSATSTISAVVDSSLNARTMTQATPSKWPYYYSSEPGLFNEKPFLRFNSDNLYSPSFSVQSQPNAMIGVFFLDFANGGVECLMRAKTGGPYNQAVQVNAPANGRKLGLYAGVTGAVGTSPLSNWGVQAPGGPYVVAAYFNGASSFIRVNGKYVMKNTSSNHIGSDGIDQFEWGDDQNGAIFCSPGCCLLAHGAPSLDEILQCERYFAIKYGVRLSVE